MKAPANSRHEVNRRPVLLTSCCYTPGIERWIDTCREHLLYQVDPLILMFKPHFPVPDGFAVIKMEHRYNHDCERWLPLPEILLRHGLDRWYVWTDFADVYFQAPLPSLDRPGQQVQAYVCPQDIIHRETPFWRPFLSLEGFAVLEDQPVYDLGCMAIRGRFFLDFVNYLLMYKTFLRQHPLPVEQLFFNKWLYFQKNSIEVMEGLAVALYASYSDSEGSAGAAPRRGRLGDGPIFVQ
jgi:hypothetical protein